MNNTITRAELRHLVDAGAVTVVEALPAPYYEDAHLPGAINIPHTEVRDLAPSLLPDKDAPIVVYCANLPCPNSEIATRVLGKLGYTNVREYAEGKDDWREAGLPLEHGASVPAVPERV
jgi:rhodanese-related sulfurtransferase